MLKRFAALSIVLLTATPSIASDMPIPIPNPPVTQSTSGGQTLRQCLVQASNMRIARQGKGWTREASSKLWSKHVGQCKARSAFASPPGQGTPRGAAGGSSR
jgi:hypothetical protein